MVENVIKEIFYKSNELEDYLSLLKDYLIEEKISEETKSLFEKVSNTFFYIKGVTDALCGKMLYCLKEETNQNK